MRAVVQRVLSARVTVDERETGAIEKGLLVYLGVGRGDTEQDLSYLVDKVLGLRIFPDEQGKMNRSVLEAGGALLVVSQFTLYGDARKGRRPAFDAAMEPEAAKRTYEQFVERARAQGITVATGEFRAHMLVSSVNDGPVTLLLDSGRLF